MTTPLLFSDIWNEPVPWWIIGPLLVLMGGFYILYCYVLPIYFTAMHAWDQKHSKSGIVPYPVLCVIDDEQVCMMGIGAAMAALAIWAKTDWSMWNAVGLIAGIWLTQFMLVLLCSVIARWIVIQWF